MNTAAMLLCGLDGGRRSSSGPFVGDELLQALDAVIGEGSDAIFTDPVDAQTTVFREHVD